jgi:hypothetical protein
LPMGTQGSTRAALLGSFFGFGASCVCAQTGDNIKRKISSNFFIGQVRAGRLSHQSSTARERDGAEYLAEFA